MDSMKQENLRRPHKPYFHSKLRARQRYRLELSWEEYQYLCNQIRLGYAPHHRTREDGMQIYRVWIHGITMPAVWTWKKGGRIITLLPRRRNK